MNEQTVPIQTQVGYCWREHAAKADKIKEEQRLDLIQEKSKALSAKNEIKRALDVAVLALQQELARRRDELERKAATDLEAARQKGVNGVALNKTYYAKQLRENREYYQDKVDELYEAERVRVERVRSEIARAGQERYERERIECERRDAEAKAAREKTAREQAEREARAATQPAAPQHDFSAAAQAEHAANEETRNAAYRKAYQAGKAALNGARPKESDVKRIITAAVDAYNNAVPGQKGLMPYPDKLPG